MLTVIKLEAMALIEIVDLPNLKMVIFQFAMLNYQMVTERKTLGVFKKPLLSGDVVGYVGRCNQRYE